MRKNKECFGCIVKMILSGLPVVSCLISYEDDIGGCIDWKRMDDESAKVFCDFAKLHIDDNGLKSTGFFQCENKELAIRAVKSKIRNEMRKLDRLNKLRDIYENNGDQET